MCVCVCVCVWTYLTTRLKSTYSSIKFQINLHRYHLNLFDGQILRVFSEKMAGTHTILHRLFICMQTSLDVNKELGGWTTSVCLSLSYNEMMTFLYNFFLTKIKNNIVLSFCFFFSVTVKRQRFQGIKTTSSLFAASSLLKDYITPMTSACLNGSKRKDGRQNSFINLGYMSDISEKCCSKFDIGDI